MNKENVGKIKKSASLNASMEDEKVTNQKAVKTSENDNNLKSDIGQKHSNTVAVDTKTSKKGAKFNKRVVNTKRLAMLALFTALAYAFVVTIRVPAVAFLKYEPKDVIIVMAGFIYGPMASVVVSVLSSFIEMITISDTAWWGLIMNVLSSLTFALPATIIYKYRKSKFGALGGMLIGVVIMTGAMLGFNVLITPLYLDVPRGAVIGMLAKVFLPFNAIKGLLNTGIIMLVYKPVIKGLRKANLIPESTNKLKKPNYILNLFLTMVALILLTAGILAIILLRI
ncbi:MAG TPA: ECF transporter S component [Clostridiales bacterium]|nr:ECF transporter S component [Clostridiales bacterium]